MIIGVLTMQNLTKTPLQFKFYMVFICYSYILPAKLMESEDSKYSILKVMMKFYGNNIICNSK